MKAGFEMTEKQKNDVLRVFTFDLNFSMMGAHTLVNHLEALKDDKVFDKEYLRWEYTEYKDIKSAAFDYGINHEDLEKWTVVLRFYGGVIVQNF